VPQARLSVRRRPRKTPLPNPKLRSRNSYSMLGLYAKMAAISSLEWKMYEPLPVQRMAFAERLVCSSVIHGAAPNSKTCSRMLTRLAIAMRFYNAYTTLYLFENISSITQCVRLCTSWQPQLLPPHLVHRSILNQPMAQQRSPVPSLHSET